MKDTTPIFFIGSGRCGTYSIAQFFQKFSHIDSHHEYCFEQILRPAVLYKMGLVERDYVKKTVIDIHLSAVYYSDSPYWIDSSNALVWIIDILKEVFPAAKYVYLTRDGRKVVSSFFHKFTDLMYSDSAVNALIKWISSKDQVPLPPPDKKYWRPLAMERGLLSDAFLNYNRFQRLCYYWAEANKELLKGKENPINSNEMMIKFEDIYSKPKQLSKITDLVGIEMKEEYIDFFKRPINVHVPINYPLSEMQEKQFHDIADDMMNQLGYNTQKEYNVEY